MTRKVITNEKAKLLKNKFKDFKLWCAASTHSDEEY
jgi:3-deoxy-D-manno-octulosonic-acid transferase